MEQHDWTYYAFVGGCVALALFIRLRRIGKTQRLRLGTLWIIPAILVLLTGMIFWTNPPHGFDWLWIALGFAIGGAMGWYRARFVDVGIDAETGKLNQRSSPGALIFLCALMAFRWLLHSAVMLGDARWHFDAMLVSDSFIAAAVGALSFYRVEIYLRARQLLRTG